MICMNYDHSKKFGLLKFHSGYETFNLNSPKGYNLKIINAQTAWSLVLLHATLSVKVNPLFMLKYDEYLKFFYLSWSLFE